ncbi:MAG TPA: hypothetical protein VHE37_13450 [Nevskiaceae bacterium]|nr:hypothetical protein [Nevskiaceae bacterium]
MPIEGYRGPYRLTPELINERVVHTGPGAYALGNDNGYTFSIRFVGCADDLGRALREHADRQRYRHFEFRYVLSARIGFEQQCRLYHTYTPPDNPVHPQRPAGTDWCCPVCNPAQPEESSAVSRASKSTKATQ